MWLSRFIGAILLSAWIPVILAASPVDELQSAAKEKKVAFALISEPGAAGVDEARDIINEARKKVENSLIVELNRADEANASFIKEYGLSTAPVPLILVFASNGAIGGGLPASMATPENLLTFIPTPKKAEFLEKLQTGKPVFIAVSKTGMAGASAAYDACMDASKKIKGGGSCVQVDIDDKAEASFLKDLSVALDANEPVTVVINAQGQVAATFKGAVDATKLVEAATKKAAGCCPPGSGKTCEPTPKSGKGK